MKLNYELSLEDHEILITALETRLERINRLLEQFTSERDSAETEDRVSMAIILEYREERDRVGSMLHMINDGIVTISNTLLQQSAIKALAKR